MIRKLVTIPESAVILGVDPGDSGGAAALRLSGAIVGVRAYRSEDRAELARWVSRMRPATVLIERVSSSPQMGVVSAHTFGRNAGWWEGVFDASGIEWGYVEPRAWQRALRCETGGDKRVSLLRARRVWPEIKVTHATADALLIAEHGRRSLLAILGVEPTTKNRSGHG